MQADGAPSWRIGCLRPCLRAVGDLSFSQAACNVLADMPSATTSTSTVAVVIIALTGGLIFDARSTLHARFVDTAAAALQSGGCLRTANARMVAGAVRALDRAVKLDRPNVCDTRERWREALARSARV